MPSGKLLLMLSAPVVIEVSLVFREKGPGLQGCVEFSSPLSMRHLFCNSYRIPGSMLRMKSKSLCSGCKFSTVLQLAVSFLSESFKRVNEISRDVSPTRWMRQKSKKMKWVRTTCNGILQTAHDPKRPAVSVYSLASLHTFPSPCSFTYLTILWVPSLQWAPAEILK